VWIPDELGSFFFRKEEDVNGDQRARASSDLGVSHPRVGGGAEEARQATTRNRAPDLDLLRLSCLCRANALLLGRPERSITLARIHRFFDGAPEGAGLDDLLLSALISPPREAHVRGG